MDKDTEKGDPTYAGVVGKEDQLERDWETGHIVGSTAGIDGILGIMG